MRNALIALAVVAGTAAPSFAQSICPEPWLTDRGLPPAYDRDSIRPNNDKEVPASARTGDGAPVGAFGNPVLSPGYVQPAPGLGPEPVDPMYPDYYGQ